MSKVLNQPELIVADYLQPTAQEVIDTVRRNTSFQYLLDAKLGDAENGPMLDADTAAKNDTPFYTIAIKWRNIVNELRQTDRQHGNPLDQIAKRTNDIITRAAILNRHNHRPPLYAETTISEFAKLNLATPEDSPLIRAAGHVTPPPIFPLNHDLSPILRDIAAHMAASHEPQSTAQILRSVEHRKDLLKKWPHLELELFIRRTAGICQYNDGLYHPDQPWGQLLSSQRLVTNTVLRIFKRDQEPRTRSYLVEEVERLVAKQLPDDYNTLNAVRAALSRSDEISWQGRSTFGLKEWTSLELQNMAGPRGKTGDVIYAFLMEHGPTEIEHVIEHVQRTTKFQRRTIQEAINHDPSHRFIRLSEQRVAANPIPENHNPQSPPLVVVLDEHRQPPAPMLRESELLWITHYVQALNKLQPPLPDRVAITGPRTAGFALDGPMEISIVVDDRNRPSLEPRLAKCTAAATKAVPSVQPIIRIMSTQQWTQQQDGQAPVAHHNVWFPLDATPQRDGP